MKPYGVPFALGHFVKTVGADMFTGSLGMEPSSKLYFINGVDTMLIRLSKKVPSSKSTAIQLKDSTFLFGKDFELIQFDKSGVITRLFLEKNIQTLYQDSRGKIWVGLHQGGVLCFQEGKLINASKVHYLGDKTVVKIAEEVSRGMWFATLGNGLYFMNEQPLVEYSPPMVYSDSLSLNKLSISSKSANSPLVNKMERIISIGKNEMDSIPPKIFINHVKLFGRDTVVQQVYNLPYDHNFITIDYVGFSSGNGDKLQYRYALLGLKDEWTYTSSLTANYNFLPPGKYRFLVEAVNNSGVWSDEPASIAFIIHPPFWKTAWFRITSALVLLLVFIVLIQWYTKSIKQKEQLKAELDKQINKLELQALRSHMNPHFLFNTLNSIQYFITSNDSRSAVKYLSKFSKLMRTILDNSQKSRIPLKEEIEALQLYLELEQLRFKDKLEFKIIVDKSIDLQQVKIPSMLIQPYVENAILHGILHKKNGGVVLVDLKQSDGKLECIIKDNGVGRSAAMEIERNKTKTHQSKGMGITQERLDILNRSKGRKLNVQIEDLMDGEKSAGTQVTLQIPI